MTDLAEAERRVPEVNARIDGQRQIVDELAAEGYDITSAQIILDSLFITLFLSVEERHRLRRALDSASPEARAA